MSIDKYSLFGGEEAGEQRTSVDSYNKHGFMVNGVLIQGAVILLPETTLLWDVTKMEDINSDSLVALRLLRTKPGLPRSRSRPRGSIVILLGRSFKKWQLGQWLLRFVAPFGRGDSIALAGGTFVDGHLVRKGQRLPLLCNVRALDVKT
jgi:hypothetical protein